MSQLDIDECLNEVDMCEQNCHNVIGSYTCSCEQGYRLQDEISCVGKRRESANLQWP